MKERNPTRLADSDIESLCKMHSLTATWKIVINIVILVTIKIIKRNQVQ